MVAGSGRKSWMLLQWEIKQYLHVGKKETKTATCCTSEVIWAVAESLLQEEKKLSPR